MKKAKPRWQFCPYCSGELDTGWECSCGADWLPYAYPWWQRMLDKIWKGE